MAKCDRGFSQLEMVISVSMLGILSLLGMAMYGPVAERVRVQKLKSDVANLNRSISSYSATGGKIAPGSDLSEVLARLKSVASESTSQKVVGSTGSFIDRRTEPVFQTLAEAQTTMPRAYWDTAKQKLVIAHSGETPGIKEFRLSDNPAAAEILREDRHSPFSYATGDGWIWDYGTSEKTAPPSPTTASTGQMPPVQSPTSQSVPAVTPPAAPPSLILLESPVFSMAGGAFPISAFDLDLQILDPNPAGLSTLLVSIDFGEWVPLSTPDLKIQPDQSIRARAVTASPLTHLSSVVVAHRWAALPEALQSPLIETSALTFPPPSGNNPVPDAEIITVSLTNPNKPAVSQIQYRLEGGQWQDYVGPLSLAAADWPKGVQIEAVAKAAKPYWTDSPEVSVCLSPSQARKLLAPEILFSRDSFSKDVNSILVTLNNPNPAGSSQIDYQIVPVPGGAGSATGFLTYATPFGVWKFSYPGGFGIRAYAKAITPYFSDSSPTSRFASDNAGIFGGHLDLDTSNFLSPINNGSTSDHTHDITGKFDLTTIDFFALPEPSQLEIGEAVKSPTQRFKLIVVNGSLSPGLALFMEYTDRSGVRRALSLPVNSYDDIPPGELEVFSLGGSAGTSRLEKLEIRMEKDIIYTAAIIPTNTGHVRSNVPGKNGEWRNGAFTLQAVAVNGDGTDGFTLNPARSNGGHGVAASGLLWEATLFWHWSGPSYHLPQNQYIPGNFSSVADKVKSK